MAVGRHRDNNALLHLFLVLGQVCRQHGLTFGFSVAPVQVHAVSRSSAHADCRHAHNVPIGPQGQAFKVSDKGNRHHQNGSPQGRVVEDADKVLHRKVHTEMSPYYRPRRVFLSRIILLIRYLVYSLRLQSTHAACVFL